MNKNNSYSVLVDTSFLVRLLSADDNLHQNALAYYKYFLEHDITMYVSTISIAEYCVKGDLSQLPLKNLRVLPFNIQHATVAGNFAQIIYKARKSKMLQLERVLIPNDTKLFAQAHKESDICYFVTSDSEAAKVIQTIRDNEPVSFEHMDLHTPCEQRFGILPLEF